MWSYFVPIKFSMSSQKVPQFSRYSPNVFRMLCVTLSKSAGGGAQYVILDNKIKCLSLAVFFGNPTNKTVTAYMWELLIANHLDQSLWSTNQKYWAAVMSTLLHFFWRYITVLRLLPSTASCTNSLQKNQFPKVNWHISLFRNKFYYLESRTEHHWRRS